MENSAHCNQSKDLNNPGLTFKENNNNLFKLAATSLTQLYQNCNHNYDSGYAQGKQDAYEEVFKWFTYQNDSSLRNVSVVSFFNFINDKLNSTNSKLAQGINSLLKSDDLVDSNADNSSDNNMSDCNSRNIDTLNKISTDAYSNSPNANTDFAPSSNLIRRVNVNLNGFSLSDNRKRRREGEDTMGSGGPTSNQPLPFALRSEHFNGAPNPFSSEQDDNDEYVFLPKRKKVRPFLNSSASNN